MAPAAKDWLLNTHEAQVLHVFANACNLINEHREVLSIVTPQIGNGPFNLVIREDLCFSEYLSIESKISTSPTQLYLGGLLVHTASAEIWNPCPDWKSLHDRRNKIARQVVELPLPIDPPLLPPFLISDLSSSLALADLPSSLAAAKQLAGLGAGFTPAGDDFIMGALHAAWIIHPAEIANVLGRETVSNSAPRTTSLSAAWLHAAGRGEAGILWHQLFDAMTSGDPTEIQAQVTRLLSVGHTSGADALAGFISLFRAWREHCSNL